MQMEKKTYLQATFSDAYLNRFQNEILKRCEGEIVGFKIIEDLGESILLYQVIFDGIFTEFISEKSIEDGLFKIVKK